MWQEIGDAWATTFAEGDWLVKVQIVYLLGSALMGGGYLAIAIAGLLFA